MGEWQLKDTTFQGLDNETWSVEVNAYTVEKVKADVGVDLYEVVSDTGRDVFSRLADDPPKLVAVLHVLCEEQIEKRGTTPQQWARVLGSGDALDAATEALINGVINFSRPSRRAVLEKMLDKMRLVETRVVQRAESKLDSEEIDALIDKALTQFDATFIAAAESSASKAQGD